MTALGAWSSFSAPLAGSGTHATRIGASHVGDRLYRETDTGLVYFDDGTNWIPFHRSGAIAKTADETVNNSATFQNDDELLFPVEASEQWQFEAMLFCGGASVNSDFKFTFTAPTSPTAGGFFRRGADAGGVTAGTTPTTMTAFGSQAVCGSGASVLNLFLVELCGYIVNGANAGTVNLKWAQNTATVENSIVYKGSQLRVVRQA